jgi:nucleotide-binding universal stress UspA family protein
MNKVLIAMDYHPGAQKVAEVGFSLAKIMGAKAILLHVISDPVYYSSVQYSPITGFAGFMDTDPLLLDSEDGLRKASEHFLEKAKHHLGDETIQILVKDGDPAEAILEAAKELHADIIAIGSHSRKWLENIIMGSVTEKVLHHTSLPMFIIPIKEHN